ncbi:hypothetical protein FNU76_16495 [Chitinimonas arctica]|uniref:Phasin family protein n=1 Tax=Chitinimonas arctica TaxID=2594795 RepID=A0A516SI33_9NEIS|nr:hypothetical protein [Chitinimonas arctica]QDQ27814.1 hypothetical protein FNU76_16495 [Chitinimonas arctica]
MNAPHAAWPLPRLEQQIDFLSEGADLANRNFERLIATQFDGCRDWMKAVNEQTEPVDRLEHHLDQGLHLGCALFVAQISAMTDAMQLLERTLAEQQRGLLSTLDKQPDGLGEPMKKAVCISSCAFDSMSKATRQVANFASNRFAAAAVSAFQQAKDKMAEQA